jgi:tetratricopeptide (TPR) repeat protein
MRRVYRLAGWGYVVLCATLITTALRQGSPIGVGLSQGTVGRAIAESQSNAAQWFRRVKPYCNSVEVTTLERGSPAPATVEGAGYHAACLALAGKIDDARRVIDALPESNRYQAAGIVFDVGHPVADAGDDRSAGPIMELVIDYWPNHYMALYHAGMAEYMLGQRDLAKHNLTEFLRLYHENDGWHANGVEVLARLNDASQSVEDPRRPREPQ